MEAISSERVHVGVAGWSYSDWKDTVYRLPAEKTQQPDLFGHEPEKQATYASDELAFLCNFVDMLEINSSFYRIPCPETTAGWCERVATRAEFFFTAKLNQEFTHRHSLDRKLAQSFRSAFAPLRETQKLHAILAQFRYDFFDRPEARQLLRWIHAEFADFAPLVYEVRHKSWESAAALDFFRELNVAVAHLDYPQARNSFGLYQIKLAQYGYLRLHGRNRQAWFSKEASAAETYNYDYADHEIQQLAERARAILGNVRELTIVANNHYRGKAVSTALRLKAALRQQKVAVPAALMETYPELQRIQSREHDHC